MMRSTHGLLWLALLSYLPPPTLSGVDACTQTKAGITGGCATLGATASVVGGITCAVTFGIGCAIAAAGAIAGATCGSLTSELMQCEDSSDIEALHDRLEALNDRHRALHYRQKAIQDRLEDLHDRHEELENITDQILGYVQDIATRFVKLNAITQDILEVVKRMDDRLIRSFFEGNYVTAIQSILTAQDLYQHEVVAKSTSNGLITPNQYTDDWKQAVLFGRYDIRGALYTIEDMIEGQDYVTENPSVYELAHKQGFCTIDLYNYVTGLLVVGDSLLQIARQMYGDEIHEADTAQFSNRLKLSENMYIRYCSCNETTCVQPGPTASGGRYEVVLLKGASLTSPNGEAALKMREDGNLVVICPLSGNNNPIWESGTAGRDVREGLVITAGGSIYLPISGNTKPSVNTMMGWWEMPGGTWRCTECAGAVLTISDNHNVELRDRTGGWIIWQTNTAWMCPYDKYMTVWSNEEYYKYTGGTSTLTSCTAGRYITAMQFRVWQYWLVDLYLQWFVNIKITCSDGEVKYATDNWSGFWDRQLPSVPCTEGVAELAGRLLTIEYGYVHNAWLKCTGSSQVVYSNSNGPSEIDDYLWYSYEIFPGAWNAKLYCRPGLAIVGIEVLIEETEGGITIVNWRLECARVD